MSLSLAEPDTYDVTMSDRPTIAQLCNRWHELNSSRWERRTREAHRHRLDLYVLPRWGDHHLDELDEIELSRWFHRDMGHLAPATLAGIRVTFNQPLAGAVEDRLIDRNPLRQVKIKMAPLDHPEIPSTEAIKETIDKGYVDRAAGMWGVLTYTAALTGMRRGELCGLQWRDIGDTHIFITRSVVGTRKNATVKAPKSARSRRKIALGPDLKVNLSEWRDIRRTNAILDGYEHKSSGFVFTFDPTGRTPMPPDNITTWWCRNRTDESIRFHDLRHWAASQMLAAGWDPITVASRLGHDPVVLMTTYAHLIPERDAEAAAELEVHLI